MFTFRHSRIGGRLTLAIQKYQQREYLMGMISATPQGERDAIERAQRGSAAAFELLYQSHQRRVYLLCLRMSGNPADAEDLAQEAFLQVFRKITTFRGECEFSTWLHRLTVNVVLTHRRRKRLPQVVLDPQRKQTAGESGEPCLAALRTMPADLLERIGMERALAELLPKGRAVVMLHDLEGYTHREIAAALECSAGTSKAHLHRAHQKLREVLQAGPRQGRATASGCVPAASGGGRVVGPARAEAGTMAWRRPAAEPTVDARRLLFVHRQRAAIQRCLPQLCRQPWAVSVEAALTELDLAPRLRSSPGSGPSYDLVLAEFPSPLVAPILRQLHLAGGGTPIIFLAEPAHAHAAAELARQSRGGDWIAMNDGLAELPDKVRRALDAEHLRRQRDSAREELRQTHAHLRALMGNPTYGIARFDPSGRLLEGNQALAAMFGYATREEMTAAAHAPGGLGFPLVAMSTLGVKAVEREWRRKDGSSLPVRCSGLEVSGGTGARGESQVIVEDLTAQRAQVARLRHHATTDALTGLVNYGELLEVLERELQRSQRTGLDLALVLLDLDGLKGINDSYGHLVGNRALSRIAMRLVSCCRSMDTSGRFGGDEFAIIAPKTGAVAAELLALRIRACCQTDVELPRLSVSIGTACHTGGAASIESLLAAADSALYRAKSQRKRALVEAPARLRKQFSADTVSPSLARVRMVSGAR
ncbi:MAG TPA: sigma-70 family RNA polymerase sigma factor [Terriglobales bacterium]|nr:sigma-70 family RNA polymerase sigma factor [Terriglobales bacterium]